MLASEPERQRLTATGVMVGTPGYMAPEQLEGAPGDARSDVFALGTVLYELVSGTNPFQGKTSSSTAARILTLDPAPLSTLNPLFPPALDAIVARCLKKSPAERYESAAEVAAELESLARAMAAESSRPRRLRRRRGPSDRRGCSGAFTRSCWWRCSLCWPIWSWWLAAWVGQPLRYTLFAAVLALAVADGTMRVHLLFVERHTPAAMLRQLARTRPWLMRLDLAIALHRDPRRLARRRRAPGRRHVPARGERRHGRRRVADRAGHHGGRVPGRGLSPGLKTRGSTLFRVPSPSPGMPVRAPRSATDPAISSSTAGRRRARRPTPGWARSPS